MISWYDLFLGKKYMPVILEPHNLNWTKTFLSLKSNLVSLFGSIIANIEHFGATSIPAVHAQPFIDIAGTTSSLEDLDERISTGLPPQYKFLGDHGVEGRRFIAIYNEQNLKIAHVHLFAKDNSEYSDRIQFRDYLLMHPNVAKEYNDLKIKLAIEFRDEPRKYWDGKYPFVKSILQRARVV